MEISKPKRFWEYPEYWMWHAALALVIAYGGLIGWVDIAYEHNRKRKLAKLIKNDPELQRLQKLAGNNK